MASSGNNSVCSPCCKCAKKLETGTTWSFTVSMDGSGVIVASLAGLTINVVPPECMWRIFGCALKVSMDGSGEIVQTLQD